MSNPNHFPVIEVFGPTVQGEGAVIGCQTMFIRFGGCDFRCRMCDSWQAVDPELVKLNAEWLHYNDIIHRLNNAARVPLWVTLSGGNPCMWDLYPLITKLIDQDWKIAVETQGSIWQPWLAHCAVVTVSPKGPGMGEKCDFNTLETFVRHLSEDQLNFKVVVFEEADLDFAEELSKKFPGVDLYLSVGNSHPPAMGRDFIRSIPIQKDSRGRWVPSPYMMHTMDLLEKGRLIVQEVQKRSALVDARILPQWHVLLWGNKQGV